MGAVRELAGAGVVDAAYYAAQAGLDLDTADAAARHFLDEGARARLSPHPLIDWLSLPERAAQRIGEDPRRLLGYLRRRGSARRLSPLFDPAGYTDPETAARHPGGALGLFLSEAGAGTPLPGCPGVTLGRALGEMHRHFLARESSAAPPQPRPDLAAGTAVVVVAATSAGAAAATLGALREAGVPGPDCGLLVVDALADRAGSAHVAAHGLAMGASTIPGSTLLGSPRDRLEGVEPAIAVGLRVSSAEVVVALEEGVLPRRGWLDPLREGVAEADAYVRPLLLAADDTVASAGDLLVGGGRLPFLAGHPADDARRAGALTFRSAPRVAAAVRRSAASHAAGTRTAPGSVVTVPRPAPALRLAPVTGDDWPLARERWAGLGFDVDLVPGAGVVARRRDLAPRRWGLRLPSPGGDRGDRWGDTHFGDSLATALRAAGQEVVTHRHGAHDTPVARLDDVVLGLRGLDRIHPIPGRVNVLWVISHPDEVTVEELEGFDLVYAASPIWADQMSARTRRPVLVMLQATDVAHRADMSEPAGTGEQAVFVGSVFAHRSRPVVEDAVAAGVRFRAYGPWRGRLDDRFVGGDYVANEQVPTLYRRSGLVLNDHHPDMARLGFVSNRLYDAVASGARVVSDPAPGLEMFGGAVQVYRSREELAWLCSHEGRAAFPSDAELADIADTVIRDHSFDARARTLVAAIEEVEARVRAGG